MPFSVLATALMIDVISGVALIGFLCAVVGWDFQRRKHWKQKLAEPRDHSRHAAAKRMGATESQIATVEHEIPAVTWSTGLQRRFYLASTVIVLIVVGVYCGLIGLLQILDPDRLLWSHLVGQFGCMFLMAFAYHLCQRYRKLPYELSTAVDGPAFNDFNMPVEAMWSRYHHSILTDLGLAKICLSEKKHSRGLAASASSILRSRRIYANETCSTLIEMGKTAPFWIGYQITSMLTDNSMVRTTEKVTCHVDSHGKLIAQSEPHADKSLLSALDSHQLMLESILARRRTESVKFTFDNYGEILRYAANLDRKRQIFA